MKHSNHGVVRNKSGEEQPADKRRAQTVHKADPKRSVSREATRDPKSVGADKTPASGTTPDDSADGRTK
jgi:hypothetical protein